MDKIILKPLFFLLVFSVVFLKPVFPQDSVCTKSPEESLIKKGNWAIVFEVGTLLWGSYGSNNANIECYNFLIKYHICDRTAIRLNCSLYSRSMSSSDFTTRLEDENKYANIELNGNLQYFITKKYFAKPFLSFGPYYAFSYNRIIEKRFGYESKSNNWSIGMYLTFGAELFVYKNIGLIGEYIISGSFNKYNYSFYNSNDNTIENNTKIWKARANTSRFGLSFYF